MFLDARTSMLALLVKLHHPWAHSYQATPSPSQPHVISNVHAFTIGKLNVTVVAARYIKGDKFHGFGMASPYAIIKLGGSDVGILQTMTSIQKKAGSAPVWRQVFSFLIKKPHLEYNLLSISLFNHRKLPGTPSLGKLSIVNLGPYVTGHGNRLSEQWYPLYLDGDKRGEICLVFEFLPMSADDILRSTDLVTVSTASVEFGNSNAKAEWNVVGAGLGAAQVAVAGVGLLLSLI